MNNETNTPQTPPETPAPVEPVAAPATPATPTTETAATPEAPAPIAPVIEPEPATVPIDADTLLALAANKTKRKKAIATVLAVVGGSAGVIILLTSMGSASQSYDYVSQLNSYATTFVWIIAIATGIFTAYMTVHPTAAIKPAEGGSTRNIVFLVLAGVGLFLGVIPGIIMLLLYFMFRQPKNANGPANKAAKAGVLILSFILGLIPGLILAFILSYPLSKHACELSGSKYC